MFEYQHIICPHCNGRLVDDVSLAGQLVRCPHCGGQIHWPNTGPLAPPVVAPPVVVPMQPSTQPSFPVMIDKGKGQPLPEDTEESYSWGTRLWGGVVLFVFMFYLSGMSPKDIFKSKPKRDYEVQGYHTGFRQGRDIRSTGNVFASSREEQDKVAEFVIRMLLHDANHNNNYESISLLPPQESFTEWKKGFKQGFSDGFSSRSFNHKFDQISR